MGRPAKKKCYFEAKARRKGEIQAELEMHRKKPLDESFKEHIGKIIDNTKVTEIAELVATLGITPIVYDIIKESSERLASARKHYTFIGSLLRKEVGSLIPTALDWPEEVMLAFAVSWIIIRHGGQLLGLLDKGLTAIVPMLLGIG